MRPRPPLCARAHLSVPVPTSAPPPRGLEPAIWRWPGHQGWCPCLWCQWSLNWRRSSLSPAGLALPLHLFPTRHADRQIFPFKEAACPWVVWLQTSVAGHGGKQLPAATACRAQSGRALGAARGLAPGMDVSLRRDVWVLGSVCLLSSSLLWCAFRCAMTRGGRRRATAPADTQVVTPLAPRQVHSPACPGSPTGGGRPGPALSDQGVGQREWQVAHGDIPKAGGAAQLPAIRPSGCAL